MKPSQIAQHTPGPWTGMIWEGTSSHMKNSTGSTVFRITTGTIPTLEDARLIAAAPEMFEMLCTLSERTADGHCTSCGCSTFPDGYCGCAPQDDDPVTYQRRCDARALLDRIDGKE